MYNKALKSKITFQVSENIGDFLKGSYDVKKYIGLMRIII